MQPVPTKKIIIPATARGGNKLTEDEKVEFCRLIGQFERPAAIRRWTESIGKPFANPCQVMKFYQASEKWKPLIEKYRREFNADIANIPIANKTHRLRELDTLYGDLDDMQDNCISPDTKFGCIDRKVKVINQAQEELEGRHPIEQNNLYVTQFNNMSRQEFDEFRLKLADKVQRYKNENVIEVKPEEEKS